MLIAASVWYPKRRQLTVSASSCISQNFEIFPCLILRGLRIVLEINHPCHGHLCPCYRRTFSTLMPCGPRVAVDCSTLSSPLPCTGLGLWPGLGLPWFDSIAWASSSFLVYCMERIRLQNEARHRSEEPRDRALMILSVLLDWSVFSYLYTNGSLG